MQNISRKTSLRKVGISENNEKYILNDNKSI